MKITRWLAPINPSKEQIKMLLESEGLDIYEETFDGKVKIQEHRHPFSEVRVVVSGELLFNIAGNQFLMRPGDRVEIPANTRHSHVNNSNQVCLCLCSQRSF